MATTATWFVAEISTQGGFSGTAQTSGKIYAIKSLIPRGDYDRDGDTDGTDFLQWQRQLGTMAPEFVGADGDRNGLINGADLAVWSGEFGSSGLAASQKNRPGTQYLGDGRTGSLACCKQATICRWP